jgi:hypothetical protein
MFRKLDLFPSSGEERETPALLGPLERANLNVVFSSLSEFWTMDKVLRPTLILSVIHHHETPFDSYFLCESGRKACHETVQITSRYHIIQWF